MLDMLRLDWQIAGEHEGIQAEYKSAGRPWHGTVKAAVTGIDDAAGAVKPGHL
jgi:hypothetical protein